jgi:hypothetical protein
MHDSLQRTAFYQTFKNTNTPLLTTDIRDIKILVNEAKTLKLHLDARHDYELPNLIEEATELIQLLKKAYKLK